MISLQDFMPTNFGHEVYVLDEQAIHADQTNGSVDIWSALHDAESWILFGVCALAIGGIFAIALYLKSTRPFKRFGAWLDKASMFAPDLIRIAFGASLLFSASNAALYGPELPLADMAAGKFIQAALWVCGTAIIIGFWSRVWAVFAGLIWTWAFITEGVYLLTYVNYLGEAIAIFLLPIQRMSIDYIVTGKEKSARLMKNAAYSMPVARILFGLSLLYTAVSIKFMETALSLDVVNSYDLTNFFPFPPLFVVLGAALIEVAVALLYMAGLLQRFTTVIFLVFMTLSLLFFKESVWPHYLLIAIAIGIFLHKPDKLAADRYLFPSSPTKITKPTKKTKTSRAK